MNWNPTEDNWKQISKDVKRRWGKLVDDQLVLWTGKRDHPKQVADSQARQQDIEPPK
jgi:uncharacterized protein YjbJ (UPF0337 family)